MDLAKLDLLFPLSVKKIPPNLEVHPEGRSGPEEPGEAEGSTRRDPTPAIHDFVYPLIRDVNPLGKNALGQAHGFEELLLQHFPRVGWLSICWDTYHDSLHLVVIDYLDIFCPGICPLKTQPVPVIDPDAGLSRSFSKESLKTIPRRDA
jgi:hypothetical protein